MGTRCKKTLNLNLKFREFQFKVSGARDAGARTDELLRRMSGLQGLGPDGIQAIVGTIMGCTAKGSHHGFSITRALFTPTLNPEPKTLKK